MGTKQCRDLAYFLRDYRRFLLAVVAGVVLLCPVSPLFAARAKRAVEVLESEVSTATVSIKIKKRTEQHEVSCVGLEAGVVKPRGTRLLFTSYKKKVKNLVNRGANAVKIERARKLNKQGGKACKSAEPPGPGPEPTPTPQVTPTPPGPTPTPIPANFDEQGNVTTTGKITFGIPFELEANRFTGAVLYQATCYGCHGTDERGLFFNFDQIRTATSGFPMMFTELTLPNEELAHLTAYLNRGNP